MEEARIIDSESSADYTVLLIRIQDEHPLSLSLLYSYIVLQVLGLLCAVAEYDEMPVRHNEDRLNTTLSEAVRFKIDTRLADDPHVKTNLLLQASSRHVSSLQSPMLPGLYA